MRERIRKGIPAEDGRKGGAIEIQPSVSTEHTKQKGLCRTKWTPSDGHTQKAQPGGPQQGPCTGEQPGPEGGRSESQLTFGTITPE